MILAFTGARTGLTDTQRLSLRVVLADPAFRHGTLHNGVAVGADEACLLEADALGSPALHMWPASHARWRFALAVQFDWRGLCTVHGVRPPLVRNRLMAEAAQVLVACPDGPERQRSGTWSTVRHARKLGRTVVIVWPDGRIEREGA